MKITLYLYNIIIKMVPDVPPETGGVLGERNGVICTVAFDEANIQRECYSYVPNVERLNAAIAQWEAEGLRFAGLFHSHPTNQKSLSTEDKKYIGEILKAMPDTVPYLYFPLVIPCREMIIYKARRGENQVVIVEEELEIIKEEQK